MRDRTLVAAAAGVKPARGSAGARCTTAGYGGAVSEVSVVMPAHNEEHYLAGAVSTVVEGLRKRRLDFDVLVVENGSSDRTAAVAASLSHRYPEVASLSRPVADYGQALRAGFLASAAEIVVNFDVDYVDLVFLDAAMDLVERQAPLVVVVGSKRSPGAGDHRSGGRRAITATFSLVLRYAFGLKVSDTHGVKLLRRAPLVPLVAVCRFGGDIFDTELVLRAERAGYAVSEIPVTVADQRPPRTSILRRIPRSLKGLARLRIALWTERLWTERLWAEKPGCERLGAERLGAGGTAAKPCQARPGSAPDQDP